MLKQLMTVAIILTGATATSIGSQAQASAQQTNIARGVVVDEEGEPMIGASVRTQHDSKYGSVTDVDGRFTLTNVKRGEKLEIYAIGYKPITVVWEGSPLEIHMEISSEQLGEVVVTAMGIQREARTLTYATQTVKSDEVTRIKSTNFVNALQGKSAGLTITPNNSGAGGGASKITLRGNTSILGTNQPLIVLDGVPMQDGMGSQVSADEIVYGGTHSGDDLLSTINPDDIESMTILKGPNAAALYGSAANNGVIVITTKTGSKGAVKVDISSTTSFETIATYPKIQQVFGLGSTSGSLTGWGPQIGTRDADVVASEPWLTNTARSAVNDFFNTGMTFTNGVTLSGGTDLSRTYLSYNNTYQTGLMPNNKFERNSVMFKETFSLFDKRLNISASLNWVNQSTKNTPVVGRANSALYSLYRTAADVDMRYFKHNYYHTGTTADNIISDPDRGNTQLIGQPIQTWSWYDQYLNNPYWIANMINNDTKRDRLLGNITLDVRLWKNLKYQTRFNLDYVKTYSIEERYASLNITMSGMDLRGGQYFSSNAMSSDIYNDHMLTWNDTFNDKIDVSAAVGGSFTRQYNRSTSISTYISIWGLPNAFVPQNSATNTDATTTGATDSWHNRDWSTAAFATASVGWKDRIYVDGSYRLEWAQSFQQFETGNGYKSFGYYSAGVNVLLDKFLPKYDWLNQMKWRGSWSVVGNPIPNTLYARQSYNFSTGTISSRTPTFDDPQPETTKAFETGFDVWMFNNKFNFDLTYYNSTLHNQFMYVTTASGESKPVNTGKIRNYGLEFSANYRYVISKDWTWRTGFNIAWNDNRILETYQTETGAPYEVQVGPKDFKVIYKEGGRYGDIYVNSFARDENGYIILLNEGDIENAAPQMASGTYDTYVGNTNSPIQFGWNNTINWKNLSLYFLIDGRIGGNVMSMTESDLDLFGLSQRTADARLAALADPELQGPNGLLLMYLPDGSGRKVSIQKYYETIGSLPMEDHVYTATSVRVRDISLSYLFANLLGGGRDLTAQFSVKNAFFLYKNSPVDPDISMTAANGLSGIDNYALPTTRSFAITLKLNF